LRPEPASFTAGGYRVLVDRVEWRIIPDAATAANALTVGEVDWLDSPLPDLLIQARAFETVPFVPLGQYLPPSAYRSNLTGVLKGAVPVFWNVSKS
jgi:peptide/nickel transport system substrate-binding protein